MQRSSILSNEVRRLIKAFEYSRQGLQYAYRHEPAFRLEVLLLIAGTPVAWLITDNLSDFGWLIGAIVAVMVAEIINTAIEQVCNAVTLEHREEIKRAKDCASAAVLLVAAGSGVIWLRAVFAAIF